MDRVDRCQGFSLLQRRTGCCLGVGGIQWIYFLPLADCDLTGIRGVFGVSGCNRKNSFEGWLGGGLAMYRIGRREHLDLLQAWGGWLLLVERVIGANCLRSRD